MANRDYYEKLSRENPDKFVDGEEEVVVDDERSKYEELCREPIQLVILKRCCMYSNSIYLALKIHIQVKDFCRLYFQNKFKL